MNKITIVGRPVKDPELKELENGRLVCKVTLASDGEYSKKKQEQTVDFIPLALWGNLGKTFKASIKKGDLVDITGRLKIRSYETDGVKKYSTEVECDDYKLIRRSEKNIEKAN